MEQPEEQKLNEEQFDKALAKIYPELWRINKSLKETNINPVIIPAVINSIFEVAYVTGHGEVKIYISNRKITNIEPKPRIKLDVDALIENVIHFSK